MKPSLSDENDCTLPHNDYIRYAGLTIDDNLSNTILEIHLNLFFSFASSVPTPVSKMRFNGAQSFKQSKCDNSNIIRYFWQYNTLKCLMLRLLARRYDEYI